MTQTFSFGFSGDDIDDKEDLESSAIPTSSFQAGNASTKNDASSPALAPTLHTLQGLLLTLPSQISYNPLQIPTQAAHDVRIPRRELFDVRLQLMAENHGGESQELLEGLGTGDIRPNVYEGGFKTWECSVDLVRVLRDRGGFGEGVGVGEWGMHVVELGCGTAIPTMALFQLALSNPKPNQHVRFTLADYNYDVLRLVTIPNLLLSWAFQKTIAKSDWNHDGDLDITPELLELFLSDLQQKNITIEAISGAWGKGFVELLSGKDGPRRMLVLASETIYSPASLGVFTETLLELLKGDERAEGTALVAAKRVYFGVGGGVDDFCRGLQQMGGEAHEVPSVAEDGGGGVSRVVLEVSLA